MTQRARTRRTTTADVERGERAKEIRDLIEMSQWDFVERLNATAKALGLEPKYKYYTVSRIESRGAIDFETAAVYVALDPRQRGWEWFVLGNAGVPKIQPELYRKAAGGVKKK